jgi:hypothetical protein
MFGPGEDTADRDRLVDGGWGRGDEHRQGLDNGEYGNE